MDNNIGKINLKKGVMPKNVEAKSTKAPQVPEDTRSEAERTILDKIRSNAVASYFAAMMALGTAAPVFTSCSESTSIAMAPDNSQLIDLLLQIIENQKTQIGQGNTIIGNQLTMIGQNETIIQQNKNREAQNEEIKKILLDMKKQDADLGEGINNIYYVLLSRNGFDTQFLNVLNDIYKSNLSQEEKLDALVKLGTDHNTTLTNIEVAINSIALANPNLGDTLLKFYEAFVTSDQRNQEYQNTMTNFADKFINELQQNNSIDLTILNEIMQAREEWAKGKMDEAAFWESIKQLLTDIRDNTEVIKNTVLKISADLVTYGDKLVAGQDKQYEMLGNMNNHMNNIEGYVANLNKLQEANNETLVVVSDKIDLLQTTLKAYLDANNGRNYLTIDELQEFAGPLFDQIIKLMGGIHGSQISIGDVENALKAYRTDLTKTNSLIETLIAVVQSLNASGDSEGLNNLANILLQLKDSVDKGNADKLSALQEIIKGISNLNLSVDALVAAANDIKANQVAYMNDAKAFGAQLFTELGKIGNKLPDPAKLEMWAENYKEQLVLAQQTRMEQQAMLQIIIDKMGNGNGVNIDDLMKLMPNYTDLLQEIRDAIGNVITSNDLENFYVKTKPDLTKTNSLIETLIAVTQQVVSAVSSSGSGNSGISDAAASAIRAICQEILSAVKANGTMTESQLQALIDQFTQLKDSLSNN